MSSAWRNAAIASVLMLSMPALADVSAVASAKAEVLAEDARERRRDPGEPKVEYDGRFAFVRLRYGPAVEMRGGRFRREPPWMHDFPRADFHFLKILSEITLVRTYIDEGNILTLDDPDLAMYPVAYMSEPGFWTMSDAELEGLQNYLNKGGFIIFDDFRAEAWYNLEGQMKRALPDLRWIRIDGTHPIFDAFYRVPDPESLQSYGEYQPTYWAIFEDNDPKKRMIALANRDGDISEYWEYSGQGFYPVDLTNEAYKLGINYLVYALSR